MCNQLKSKPASARKERRGEKVRGQRVIYSVFCFLFMGLSPNLMNLMPNASKAEESDHKGREVLYRRQMVAPEGKSLKFLNGKEPPIRITKMYAITLADPKETTFKLYTPNRSLSESEKAETKKFFKAMLDNIAEQTKDRPNRAKTVTIILLSQPSETEFLKLVKEL